MSCRFSKERLALYAEGDLSGRAEERTEQHLRDCAACGQFVDQLRQRLSLLKSAGRKTIAAEDCSAMRRGVMAIITAQEPRASWLMRVERALWLGVVRRPYVLATAALLCVASVSVLAQMRHAAVVTRPSGSSEGRFVSGTTLVRPDGYRDWVVVGTGSTGVEHSNPNRAVRAMRQVFISPDAYRTYAKTGVFPEGTLMVWEAKPSALLVSVKDSARFADGWGFFDFTAPNGAVRAEAEASEDSSGCRTCHQRDAATDHVFTQFYPVLQSAHRSVEHVPQRPKAPVQPLV